MVVEEIYAEISAHMIKGLMIHEQLANYYDFLGLKGYKKCHEYHYMDETCNHRKLCRYFMDHHNKLIPEAEINAPDIIPKSWFRYTRQEVDNTTKINAIKNGISVWIDWEKETKYLYERMYKNLIDIDEVASALEVKKFICDVDEELKYAEMKYLDLKAINYSLDIIIPCQYDIHKKYAEKMKDIEL